MTNNFTIRPIEKPELKPVLEVLKRGIDKAGKFVLADLSLHMFRGVPIWVMFVDNEPVSINASYPGRRKRNVWTPHVNEYIAFTRMDVRRRGYATQVCTTIKEEARKQGCVRLKSTVSTTEGLRFHQKLGDDIWAITNERILLVDTPLVERDYFPPDSTPIEVRKWTKNTRPLTNEEIENLRLNLGLRDDNRF